MQCRDREVKTTRLCLHLSRFHCEVDQVQNKKLKADVLNVSPWSEGIEFADEGLSSKRQLSISLHSPICLINSVNKSKLLCFTSPRTQHHSFSLELGPLFVYHGQNKGKAT